MGACAFLVASESGPSASELHGTERLFEKHWSIAKEKLCLCIHLLLVYRKLIHFSVQGFLFHDLSKENFYPFPFVMMLPVQGKTSLHLAAVNDFKGAVTTLIASGSDITVKDVS